MAFGAYFFLPILIPDPLLMEALKKKELVLAALAMLQEEFDQLVADRHSLIVDSMCVSMSTSANEVIVGSPATLTHRLIPPHQWKRRGQFRRIIYN